MLRWFRSTSQVPDGPPLRDLAAACGIRIGSACDEDALHDDPDYRALLAREFDVLTPERSMKFERIQPERGVFTFDDADGVLAFAQEHDMKVRGHALLWHQMLPPWIAEGQFDREEWKRILREHIHALVSRYRGRVICWDVVNEAIADDATMRENIWFKALGEEYIDWAFHCAHEADPDAPLFYNDFGADGLNAKSDAVHALLKRLLSRDVPVHGTGLQMHLTQDWMPRQEDVCTNMKRLGDLGLTVHITEMDVRFRLPMTARKQSRQADAYRMALTACLNASNCPLFTVWGFTDRYSWVSSHFRGWGDALLCDNKLRPKKAYTAVKEILSSNCQ